MLKDRGTIKWTSLMLPEHVERLKNMWSETEKTTKPLLDPQELESINEQLVEAFQQKLPVTIAIYHDGRIEEIQGRITNIKTHEQQLVIEQKDSTQQTIAFEQVVSVHMNDEKSHA